MDDYFREDREIKKTERHTNADTSITTEWFKEWSNEYDNTLGKVKRHHELLDLVVKVSGVKDNNTVLDIGCGTGLLSLKFLEKAPCNVFGVDNSANMLSLFDKKIEKLPIGKRITTRPEDASSLTFRRNTFDIVASTVTLHHLKNKYPTIKKIHDIIKPGGRFVIGDIDVDTTGRLTDVRRLKKLLAFLNDELAFALKDGGVDAFRRMYDNGKKHILNDGEYCISFTQWAALCKRAGFKKVTVYPLPKFKWFKVLVAEKVAK
jgi:ubiquinone/menaquinone biosynthesis C-methylase UbiE